MKLEDEKCKNLQTAEKASYKACEEGAFRISEKTIYEELALSLPVSENSGLSRTDRLFLHEFHFAQVLSEA